MAQLNPDFSFTGRIGNMSAYRMKGSDKVILRTIGGPSKAKIKSHPNFQKLRCNATEFGGRSAAGKFLRRTMYPLTQLADYNISGPINALIKPIQLMDSENEFGKRAIHFTKGPKLLEGFSLNLKNPFDSIIRNPLQVELNKQELTARITIPKMVPGINFFAPPFQHPWYGFVAVLGIVPDFVIGNRQYESVGIMRTLSRAVESNWFPVMKGSAAATLEIDMNIPMALPPTETFSVMLCIGIRFGTLGMGEQIEQAKYAGAAKILAME